MLNIRAFCLHLAPYAIWFAIAYFGACLDASLGEMHRVLNRGGHLVLLELSYPHNRFWRALFGIYSKVVMPVVGRLISGDNSAYTYLPETMKAFPQGEVMREILLKNGFSRATFHRLTMGICTLYVAEK